jgi:hypothetical protein
MAKISMRAFGFCLAASFACAASAVPSRAGTPSAGETIVLGPFTGHYATLHPDNIKPKLIAYYGTDLGFTYEHQGKLQFLFGDTSADEAGVAIQASTGSAYDDGFGTIDLAEWPDPARISPTHIPLIKLGQNAGTTEMSAINPGQPMESFKTPLGGFSNGSREFGLFYSSKPQGCRVDADCASGLTCDTGLGFLGTRYDRPEGITFACTSSAPGCTANTMLDSNGAPIAGSGFCSDKTSSVWANTNVGRVSAVAVKQLIGIRSTADSRSYTSIQTWLTNKFTNVTVRTVNDFVPERGRGRAHQDYRSAQAANGNRRVFLWGRPGFIGVAAHQRSLGLYFAYVDMPAGAEFSWRPRFFTGMNAKGAPQFSASEKDAVPVDLDATRAGVQPAELHDIVDQESVVWIEPLKKWLMFYGGGMGKLPAPPVFPNCGLLELFTGAECKEVITGNGAIRMRTANDPWGPWSAPQDVIVGGDPDAQPLRDLYAAGGVLHHPACVQAGCAPPTRSPQLQAGEYGFLYGANIIEQWIKPVGPAVDVIWNASTWDPYRVILLRTRITP